MSDLSVFSEVGALERVLVHRPGPEIDRMTQLELEPLLFDDILEPELAGGEHDVLRQILEVEGATVLEVQDLLTRAVHRAPAEAVADLLDEVCRGAAVPELAPHLAAWPAERLARALVAGVRWSELDEPPATLARLREHLDGPVHLAIPPVPNLMFQRDPCIPIFDRLLVGGMATPARAREPVLVRFALQHGLEPPPVPVFDARTGRHPRERALEGGDVLVLSPQVLMVGCSERTTPETLERVAHEGLFPAFPHLEVIYAVLMPARRAVMHLDTILTQVDRDLFLGHAPMVMRGEGVAVAALRRAQRPVLLPGATVEDVLREALSPAVRVVPCGGLDPIAQQREQWTDGANAVCAGPGRIILYSRNTRTVAHLVDHHGFVEVALAADQDPAERADRIRAASGAARVVHTFVGSELSRARGGARCLTMPLRRAGGRPRPAATGPDPRV